MSFTIRDIVGTGSYAPPFSTWEDDATDDDTDEPAAPVPDTTMVRIGEGMALAQRGERQAARALFAAVWDEIGGDAGDAFHRCALAHSMAESPSATASSGISPAPATICGVGRPRSGHSATTATRG